MRHKPRRVRNALDAKKQMIEDTLARQDAERTARSAEANAANNDCARADADAAEARARAQREQSRRTQPANTGHIERPATRVSTPSTAPVYSRAAVPIYEAQMRRAAPPSQQAPAPYQPSVVYDPSSSVRASNPSRHKPRRVRNAMDERQRQTAESFADRERQEQQRRAATQAAEQRARAEAEARARAEAQAAAASVARRAAQQAGASSGPQLRTRQVLWEPSNDLPPMTAQQQEQARQEQEQARQEAERRRQREQQQRAAGLPVLRERQAIFVPNPARPRRSLRDTLRELDREIARERRVRNPAERDSKDVPNDPTARALHRFQAAMGRGGFSAAIRASHARLGRMLEIEKLLGFKYAMRQLQRDYAHMPHARAALQELIERADAEIDNLENKPRPRRG